MSSPPRTDRQPGLRERKKIRTRRAIQEAALRLFEEQGYDGTTVEQIAEAAEISPSTFFRYFPTKEDVVVQDDYDPVLVRIIAEQPPELTPVQALRATFREAFGRMSESELEQIRARHRLQTTVPALRARTAENLMSTLDLIAGAVAERIGRPADDFAVRTFAGAVIGTLIPVLFTWADEAGESPSVLMDRALGYLEEGFPFQPPAPVSAPGPRPED